MKGAINVYIQKDDMGIWLVLPADMNDFQKIMREIGAADPTDIAIGQYKTDIAAISVELLKNSDFNHVNYLAARLAEMDSKQLDELDSIMQSSFRFTTVEQLIDYTYNVDYFLFRPGIKDTAELGRYYVYETGLCQMPEEWKGGIDIEKFGSHAAKQECGVFTPKGYLMLSGDKWQSQMAEFGIPDEYILYRQE